MDSDDDESVHKKSSKNGLNQSFSTEKSRKDMEVAISRKRPKSGYKPPGTRGGVSPANSKFQ